MIERGFGLLRRLPPKVEAAVGAVGTTIYGVMTAAPSEFQNMYEEVPISGMLINILSETDLRMAAGALTIAFGVITADGLKRLINEKQSSLLAKQNGQNENNNP